MASQAAQAAWAQFLAASLSLAASTPFLPPSWQMMVDPASGKFYFYNATTGVKQWERPGVAGTGAAPAPSQCSAAATSRAAGSSASADAEAASSRNSKSGVIRSSAICSAMFPVGLPWVLTGGGCTTRAGAFSAATPGWWLAPVISVPVPRPRRRLRC